jgi:isoleucyl-tRNA synthetase
VGLSGSARVSDLLKDRWGEYFKSEVLAREVELDGSAPDGESVRVDGEVLRVKIEPLGG